MKTLESIELEPRPTPSECGSVADRLVWGQDKVGSIPTTPTNIRHHKLHLNYIRCEDGVSGSTADCESERRGSNPHLTPNIIRQWQPQS